MEAEVNLPTTNEEADISVEKNSLNEVVNLSNDELCDNVNKSLSSLTNDFQNMSMKGKSASATCESDDLTGMLICSK